MTWGRRTSPRAATAISTVEKVHGPRCDAIPGHSCFAAQRLAQVWCEDAPSLRNRLHGGNGYIGLNQPSNIRLPMPKTFKTMRLLGTPAERKAGRNPRQSKHQRPPPKQPSSRLGNWWQLGRNVFRQKRKIACIIRGRPRSAAEDLAPMKVFLQGLLRAADPAALRVPCLEWAGIGKCSTMVLGILSVVPEFRPSLVIYHRSCHP